VPALLQALGDEAEDVRKAAARALGRIGDRQAVPPLIQALGDEDEDVRSAAAKALGRIGDPRAVPVLIQALGDGDEDVRKAAAEALGGIGDRQAVPALLQALGDENWRVRSAAAEALGRIGDRRAVPSLLQALGDRDRRVRWAAAEALGRIGDRQAVPALIQALGDEDGWVRWTAAEALGRGAEAFRDAAAARRAARALWWRLTDVDKNVREAAYRALQAVVARWTELAAFDLPRQDPLQPQPEPGWRRAIWALLALASFLLASSVTVLADLLREGVPDSPAAWKALALKAVGIGLLGAMAPGLAYAARHFWQRARPKTAQERA